MEIINYEEAFIILEDYENVDFMRKGQARLLKDEVGEPILESDFYK